MLPENRNAEGRDKRPTGRSLDITTEGNTDHAHVGDLHPDDPTVVGQQQNTRQIPQSHSFLLVSVNCDIIDTHGIKCVHRTDCVQCGKGSATFVSYNLKPDTYPEDTVML